MPNQRSVRLGVGADLTGGRAQCVGRLERMTALGPLPAPLTVPDVDTELADEGRAGDLGLELLRRAGLDEAAPTVGAGVGEAGLVALGELLGRRWRAVAVLAVGVARLATGRLRVGLGRPLAERGGLPLPGAQSLVELPGQLRDLGFEFGDALEEFPTAGTRRFVHAAIVPTGAAEETAVPDGTLFNDVPSTAWPGKHFDRPGLPPMAFTA